MCVCGGGGGGCKALFFRKYVTESVTTLSTLGWAKRRVRLLLVNALHAHKKSVDPGQLPQNIASDMGL